MKCILILIFMLNCLNVFGHLSDDVIKLYTFFKWKIPKDNNECNNMQINIKFTEDNQFITEFDANFIESEPLTFPKNIDFSLFPNLQELRSFSLYGAEINTLPSCLFDLPSIDILNIRNSKVKIIPKNINYKSSIRQINLSGNLIEEFPEQFQFLNLTDLNLSSNLIKGSLSYILLKFDRLLTLDISNNSLTGEIAFPNYLLNLNIERNFFNKMINDNSRNLCELYAGKNAFTDETLDNISNYCKNMAFIDLSSNRIENVPSSIKNLEFIETLILSDNNLKTLPEEFFKLQKLSRIVLSNNPKLTAKFINFGNSEPLDCELKNTNIICIQNNTCRDMDFNNIRICSIDELTQKQNPRTKSFISIIICIIPIIFLLLNLFFWRYNKNSKTKSKSNFNNKNNYNNSINNINFENRLSLQYDDTNMNNKILNNTNQYMKGDDDILPILPSYLESNYKTNNFLDIESLNHPDKKIINNETIVDATFIDSVSENYNIIRKRIFNQNNNSSSSILPTYEQIVSDDEFSKLNINNYIPDNKNSKLYENSIHESNYFSTNRNNQLEVNILSSEEIEGTHHSNKEKEKEKEKDNNNIE